MVPVGLIHVPVKSVSVVTTLPDANVSTLHPFPPETLSVQTEPVFTLAFGETAGACAAA